MKETLKVVILFFAFLGCTSATKEDRDTEIKYGELKVPENRQVDSSREIEISYAFIPSKTVTDRPPIVFIQGGPGGSSLQMAPFFQSTSLNQKHDFILFDARGTGQSGANCQWIGEAFMDIMAMDLSLEEELQQAIDVCNRCKDELNEKNVDVAGYNSLENAADLEALRKHLDIDEWILFGGSYGTRLGFTYLREYKAAEAAVFMGIFPPEVNIYDGFIPGLARSMDYLFQQCANDPSCNERYPELETLFENNIARLRDQPLKVTYQGNDFVINAQDALLLIQQMLYQRQFIQQIPAFIKALGTGNEPVISSSINRTSQTVNFINLATYWSVQAREEVQFNEERALERDLEEFQSLKPGVSFFSTDQEILEQWHTFRSEDLEDQRVETETPILIVNGLYDPITPITNAIDANDYLPNSTLIEFPIDGHTVFNPCFFQSFEAFVANDYNSPELDCTSEGTLTWQ